MSPEPPAERSRPRMTWLLAGIACLATGLHAANLLYLARAQGCHSAALVCPTDEGPWAAGDYHTYRSAALRIRDRGLLGASYLKRTPGYPLALLASISLSGEASPARWLGPPLAGGAAAAVAWLAAYLTGRARSALLAGLLFCAWPSAYALSPALRPDGPHACLTVAAVAATLGWRASQRAGAALLAGALWVAVQSLRPTFFPLPLLLPPLLLARGRPRRYALVSLALWLATLPVPAGVIASNWVRHGVATPSHVLTVNLACYSVPRLQEELGLGEFHALRGACWARWRGMPADRKTRAQLEEAVSFLWAHPAAAAWSFLNEISVQLTYPLRPWGSTRQASLYPDWWVWGPLLAGGFWLCAAAGMYRVTLRDPGLALFLMGAGAAVMLPAATAHLVGGRLRLPVELLFLPVAVAALDSASGAIRRLRRASASGRLLVE